MDKCPSVRPIGIWDILRRLFCKVLLIVVGKEAIRVCRTDQLCTKIEERIHHIRSLCDTHKDDEDWDILLIDDMNAFNEGNMKILIWAARHEWPSGSRFLFDIYRHHTVLLMRGENKKETHFIFCSERASQICPLAMIGYGILLLPLIRKLKKEFETNRLSLGKMMVRRQLLWKAFVYFFGDFVNQG